MTPQSTDTKLPSDNAFPRHRRGSLALLSCGAGIGLNNTFVSSVEGRFQKTERLIIGCQKGGRSSRAASVLVDQGFTHILEMRGGYVGETDPFGNITFPGWCAKGYPTSTESSPGERYQT